MVSEKLLTEICKQMAIVIPNPEARLLQAAIDSCREEFTLIKELKDEMDTQLKLCKRKVLRLPLILPLDFFLELSNKAMSYHIESEKLFQTVEDIVRRFDIDYPSIRVMIHIEEKVLDLKHNISAHINLIKEKRKLVQTESP